MSGHHSNVPTDETRAHFAPSVEPVGRIIDIGVLLAKHLPRGKGAVVRALGRRFLREGKSYLRTRNGAKLVLSPDSLDVYATMRSNGNAWDYDDFLICFNGLVDGGTFYEIGANVGYFAVELAALTQRSTTICAFEPQASLARAIELSAVVNGYAGLRVVNALVGDKEGVQDFFVAPATIHSSAVSDSNRSIASVRKIQMVTIDDLVSRGAIPAPDMVKMDVEGSEHLVFRGAKDTFRRIRPHVFLEYDVQDDVGGRVRNEIESLMKYTGCYDIYCSPRMNLRSEYPRRLFRLKSETDWARLDAVVLRNRDRGTRNAEMFGP